MLLCRRLHLVTPFRMCPRRLLINRSPRYFSMWQCRRLPTVSTSHLWMLPCRRPHKVLCLSTSLHRWVLAQLPRFLLIFLFRLPYAVWCYTMLPYNYRSRSSLLAVFSRTILWTAKTLFVSPRHQYKMILVMTHHTISNLHSHQVQSWLRRSCPQFGPTCLAAATAGTRTARPAFRSCYWFALVHYTWRFCYSCTSTSPATFSYFSYASTAPCLYHPCGITSSTFSHYRQEKCQYRFGGNAQSCYYRSSCRVCSFS